jgi:hypothetical protein
VAEKNIARFNIEWNALKKLCEEQIPKALSPAELVHGGGSPVARSAKERFHVHANALLSLAKET